MIQAPLAETFARVFFQLQPGLQKRVQGCRLLPLENPPELLTIEPVRYQRKTNDPDRLQEDLLNEPGAHVQNL